jgi:ligand-binding sensor domain-containing protein
MRVRRLALAVAVALTAITPGYGQSLDAPPASAEPAENECCAWLEMGRDDARRPSGDAIHALALAPATGALWVATSAGLSRLYDGAFQHFGAGGGQVLAIATTPAGVAAATNDGLYWLDDPPADGANARRIMAGRVPSVVRIGRRLYVAVVTGPGEPARLRSIELDESFAPAPGEQRGDDLSGVGVVRSLSGAGADVMLIEQRDSQPRVFDPSASGPAPAEGAPLALLPFGESAPRTIAVDASGIPWFYRGARRAGDPSAAIDFARLAPGRAKDEVLLARQGFVERWKVSGESFTRVAGYKLPDPDLRPTAIAEDGAGRIFVGTERGLRVTDPVRGRPLRCPDPREIKPADAPAGFTDDGRVWLGGSDELRVLHPDGREQRLRNIASGPVLDASVGDETLVATEAGVLRLDGGAWKPLSPEPAALPDEGRAWRASSDRERLMSLDSTDQLLDRVLADQRLRDAVLGRHTYAELLTFERADVLFRTLEREIGLTRLAPLVRRTAVAIAAASGSAAVSVARQADARSFDPQRARLVFADGRPARDLLLLQRAGAVRGAVPSGDGATVLVGRDLLELTRDLTLLPLPAPSASPDFSPRALLAGAHGEVFLVNDRGALWKQDGRTWNPLITLDGVLPPTGLKLDRRASASLRTAVLGMVQDEGEVLLACAGCEGGPVQVLGDGRAKGIRLDSDKGEISIEAEGAVFRGKNAVWIALDGKLFRKAPGPGQTASRVKIAGLPPDRGDLLRATSLAEAGGVLWVAGADGVVYALEEAPGGGLSVASKFDVASLDRRARLSPLRLAPSEDGKAVWVGGAALLARIGEPKRPQIESFSNLFRALDERRTVTVMALLHERDGLLVLTDRGLARLAGEALVRVPLPGFFDGDREAVGTITRLSAEGLLVTARAATGGSQRWIRARASAPFRREDNLPFVVTSVVPGRDGRVIFGGEEGALLTLGPENRVEALEVLQEGFDGLLDRMYRDMPLAACDLGDGAVLTSSGFAAHLVETPYTPPVIKRTRDASGKPVRALVPTSGKATPLRLLASPWTQCATLPPSANANQNANADRRRVVVLGEAGLASVITLGSKPSNEPAPFDDATLPERAWALARCPRTDEVFLLDSRQISRWDASKSAFHPVLPLPQALLRDGGQLSLALDGSAAWVGSIDRGLWRAELGCDGQGAKRWASWDERDGLPGRAITAVLARDRGAAIAFAMEGAAQARLDGERLRVDTARQVSIAGRVLRAAELFEVGSRMVLVVGTDTGASFLAWDARGAPDANAPWLPIELGPEVRSAEVSSIRRAGDALWIATSRGIARFSIASEGDAVSLERQQTITTAQGLPAGDVLDVRAAADSPGDAWVLVRPREGGVRVTRLAVGERASAAVATTEAFLFGAVREAKLGPSLHGRAPAVLARDDAGWSRWTLDTLVGARLDLRQSLFWITADVTPASVDPPTAWSARASARYFRDGLSGAGSPPEDRLWITDFWRTRDRRIGVRLTASTDVVGRVQHVYQIAAVARDSANERALRLLVLFLPTLLVAAGSSWRVRRYLRRRRAVRARLIPYVEGGTVTGPGQFFGRRKLIEMLRDSVATTSWLLTGDFRIGKTSIQRELGRVLETAEHPTCVYYPVFIDLFALGTAGEPRFFHLIGARVVEMAKRRGCADESVLAGLEIAAVDEHGQYDAISLTNDLETLVTHLRARLAEHKKEPIIVLQIDEAGVIDGMSPGARLEFRSIFNTLASLRAVLTARTLRRDPESDSMSPWWNIFTQREIEPLTPDELRELIVTPVRGLFVYDEAVIQRIIARAEGRPLPAQRLCADILRHKYASGDARRKHITLADLDAALAEAATREAAKPRQEAPRA